MGGNLGGGSTRDSCSSTQMVLVFGSKEATKPSAEREATGTGKGLEARGGLGTSEEEVEEETITEDQGGRWV